MPFYSSSVRSCFCFRYTGKNCKHLQTYERVEIKAHNSRTRTRAATQLTIVSRFNLEQRGPFASFAIKHGRRFFSFANGFAFAILVINASLAQPLTLLLLAMLLKYIFSVLGLAPLFVRAHTLLYSYYSTTFSALVLCDQSLRMARKRMRTSKRGMNRMAYAASVLLCWYLFHFIIFQR